MLKAVASDRCHIGRYLGLRLVGDCRRLVVPVEQVTVHTDVVTEQQSVWGTVSHEEITINDDTHATHQQ